MQNEPSPSTTLAEFYRFAVLLTGNIGEAERVMAETLTLAENALAQMRNESSRRAWFVTRIREKCLGEPATPDAGPRLLRGEDAGEGPVEVLEIEAYLVAQRFHRLSEPGRSALALFYLDIFTIDEIAKLLKLDGDALASTLGSARTELQTLLRGSRKSA